MLTFDDCLAYAGAGEEESALTECGTVTALRRLADLSGNTRRVDRHQPLREAMPAAEARRMPPD